MLEKAFYMCKRDDERIPEELHRVFLIGMAQETESGQIYVLLAPEADNLTRVTCQAVPYETFTDMLLNQHPEDYKKPEQAPAEALFVRLGEPRLVNLSERTDFFEQGAEVIVAKDDVDTVIGHVSAGRYRHFKRRDYYVYGVVTVAGCDQKLVIYSPAYGTEALLARTVENFCEEVDRPDYEYRGPRFMRDSRF